MRLQSVLRRVACLFASCRPDPATVEHRTELLREMHEIPQRIDRMIERQQRNPVERTVWPDHRRERGQP